jgi:hypothetical protein
MGYALIYATFVGQMVLFVIMTMLFARVVEVRVTKITVGWPAVIPLGERVKVGPIPGASVDLYGAVENVEAPDGWRNRSLGARLLVVLAPWVITFAVAVVCLGIEHASRSFVHGFRQALILNPITLAKRMAVIAEHAPISTTIGILFAKLTAANVLPIGGLAGGQAIRELFSKRGKGTPRALETYFMISMIALLIWFIVRIIWAIAH